jgi:hypothetical protein
VRYYFACDSKPVSLDPLAGANEVNGEMVLSVTSLVLSLIAIGWNIYRDVIKGRLKVQLYVATDQGGRQTLLVKVVNHGPGIVQVQGITYRPARDSAGKAVLWVAKPDSRNPIATAFPARLEIGQEARLVFPLRGNFLEVPGLETIGITDSFGRAHWVSKRDIENARHDLAEAPAN